jgi:uncharacterized protein (DUF4415 family)
MRRVKSDQADEIRAIKRMKDAEIDTADSPPVLDWSRAVVGKFQRLTQEPIPIRLDADVLAWLKEQGDGYETRINAVLRNAMKRTGSDQFVARISDYGDFAA